MRSLVTSPSPPLVDGTVALRTGQVWLCFLDCLWLGCVWWSHGGVRVCVLTGAYRRRCVTSLER